MSRKQVIVTLAIVFALLTLLLLPVSIGISTAYLSALSPQVEAWVKGHAAWFLVADIVFALLAVTLIGISTSLTTASSPLPPANEIDDITTKVNEAVSEANKDPVLKNQSNRSSTLKNWKDYAETLIRTYKGYKTRKSKKSRHIINNIADLIEKLIKNTEKTFLFLNRKNDFTGIAKPVYEVAYDQKRWKFAADLAYEIGRVFHELGRHGESDDWIALLRKCSEKADPNGYWVKVYNGIEPDKPETLDEPSGINAQTHFHEVLAFAAKLYDLEGLNRSNDAEAQKYFEKALTRADKLPDKVLFSWIKIHIGELAPRLNRQSVIKHYTEALAPLDALDLATLDATKCSEIVNLKLICYNELGILALPNLSKGPNGKVNWYQKLLELAEEYGRPDFQVLAHVGLANSSFLQGFTQTSLPDKTQSFQNAYEHIKKAWIINKDFSGEGPRVVGDSDLADLMLSIVDELVKTP